MGDFLVRQATFDDLDKALEFRARMFLDMGRDPALVARAAAAMRAWTVDHMTRGTLLTFFAVSAASGEIAASAAVNIVDVAPGPNSLSRERGYILNVYTEPAYRHQGLASLLVGACCDACRERGIGVVTLHASDEGRYVYEKLGFKPGTEMWLRLDSSP